MTSSTLEETEIPLISPLRISPSVSEPSNSLFSLTTTSPLPEVASIFLNASSIGKDGNIKKFINVFHMYHPVPK